MSEHAAPPARQFTITGQSHSIAPDQTTGSLVGVWRVDFTTPSGVKSFVQLPDSQYSAEAVAALVAPKAAEIERVAKLGEAAG